MLENNLILCMKWGNKYPAEFVNRLYRMVKRNLSLPFTMVCLTDDATGIDENVRCYPIPSLELPDGLPERGWKKLTTFSAPLYDLQGTALFLDLDIVILRNIDHFFTHEADNPQKALWIIKDFKHQHRITGNSSVYRFKIGDFPDLLPHFRAHFADIRAKFRNEQAYLSNFVHQQSALRYFPKGWCLSYKYHALYPPVLDYLLPPRKPDCDILIFHGEVNPDQAIVGGGGKWYRHVKPAAWLADYWS